jgi:hypothetical protein
MTDSSSKLLQIQGRWYHERTQQKFQNLSKKKTKPILYPFEIAGTCDFAGAQVPHVTCDWRLKLLSLMES